ncbi:uncharacterized protein PAC_14932 [Phialocephala subalpina]|uniref:nitric-oxide synthase (NADPH) n=1 Tax=Phialocephala subalpina TaxID=576137 RepID=A0A1L7XJ12_9HELO|nr:uncharacterized protein PAC_14932 [Phialocephala subalpina]
MIRPLEPRVGEHHPLAIIKVEAEAFLHEMFDEGLFSSQAAFKSGLAAVLKEIDQNAEQTTIWDDAHTPGGDVEKVKAKGWSSSGYIQSRDELQWDIRVVWRNSRKCIMRAHYPELKLVVWRDVKTSQGMVDAIIQHTPAAFSGGRILPTAGSLHVPTPTHRWYRSNDVVSATAHLRRYEMADGSVLGDPSSTQLTKDIIGWAGTLAASGSWCAFDDQHLKEKGYRLPADPYWIAPPQGSIVPLWHRGGAPNYQPKPLIAKHRFDPVNVWKRRHSISTHVDPILANRKKDIVALSSTHPRSKVHVCFAGTGGTASKLAECMRKFLNTKSADLFGEFGCLNSFDVGKVHEGDTVLSIVATIGQGELPSNDLNFKQKLAVSHVPTGVKYSILGLGDDAYRNTFDGAVKLVNEMYEDNSVLPLMKHNVIESDVAVENPPLADFQHWWENVERMLDGGAEDGVVTFHPAEHIVGGIVKLSIEIAKPEYQDMGHIRLLPGKPPPIVEKVIDLLEVHDIEVMELSNKETSSQEDPNFGHGASPPTIPVRLFLTEYVDLLQPFIPHEWAQGMVKAENTSVPKALSFLKGKSQYLVTPELRTQILLSMPIIRPRTYSIASSTLAKNSIDSTSGDKLDTLIRVLPKADSAQAPSRSSPLATGFCTTQLVSSCADLDTKPSVTLFAGFRSPTSQSPNIPDDAKIFLPAFDRFSKHNLFAEFHITSSNDSKVRIQDTFDNVGIDITCFRL